MKKIFIVDDDRDIVDSMSIVLESSGYLVTSQLDDEDVVDAVAANQPDLIILDVMFPQNEDSGFSIARALKRAPECTDIPILMCSAINARHLFVGGMSNHDKDDYWFPVDEFLDKPASPETLLEKVSHLLTNNIPYRSQNYYREVSAEMV